MKCKYVKYRSLLSCIALSALLLACTKTDSPVNSADSQAQVEKLEENVASLVDETPVIGDKLAALDIDLALEGTKTTAHAKYLGDPMKFALIPDSGLPSGPTAVVASELCVLYPVAGISAEAELASLPAGIPVPFGTILPIGKDFRNPASKRVGLFAFQDNWNYFYETSWKGKKGIVFGADLYGLGEKPEANRISALLYNTKGKFDSFYPVSGYSILGKAAQESLARDRISFQEVRASEYTLDMDTPDDMIALYVQLRSELKQPVFISTDLAAHGQHLVFDRLLQYIEEAYLMPRLTELTGAFIAALEKRQTQGDAETDARSLALLYFRTADALLKLAPAKKAAQIEHGLETSVYEDVDREKILSGYPEAVRAEITKMEIGSGLESSSVFSFDNGKTYYAEDYSQYKPRGHYAKNGVLAAYFKAMTWYGRINFVVAEPGQDSYSLDKVSAQSLSLAMLPAALLIAETARADSALHEKWASLFDPVTALIGFSDDLSLSELLPLWEEQRPDKFDAWASDSKNLLSFMQAAHSKLRPPAISGSSVFYAPSEGAPSKEGEERRPPMGWRLFGQRFTWDSAVHHQVSAPRLKGRGMVSGLDIMKSFGSKTAETLLAAEYPKSAGLKERLDALQARLAAEPAEFWRSSYYANVLHQVKSLATFEPGAGFYFTETPAWGVKAMNSAHGSWAELRHDTILYVKQSYAERGGGGDYEATFRTRPLPEPTHYLEPNVAFWESSACAVQNLYATLARHSMLDEESEEKLTKLHSLMVRALGIAKLEAADEAVPPEDVAWIPTIANQLSFLSLIHVDGGMLDDPKQLRMALVADVFTNAETGKVLETAVGIPYRIQVALNDGQGGKRIAVGYSFSYYEFQQPLSARLDDAQWREIVYKDNPAMGKYLPPWAKGSVLPAKAK